MAWPHNKTLNQDCGGEVFGVSDGGVSDGGGGGITDGDVLVIMVLL